MAPGSSARWSRLRPRPRGQSGSAAATAAVAAGDCGSAAVADGDCGCGGAAAAGAASARTAGGDAPPMSAGGGGADAAVAAVGRGRSSWGSHRGRYLARGSMIARRIQIFSGIGWRMQDRRRTCRSDREKDLGGWSLEDWLLDQDRFRTPFALPAGFVGGGGATEG